MTQLVGLLKERTWYLTDHMEPLHRDLDLNESLPRGLRDLPRATNLIPRNSPVFVIRQGLGQSEYVLVLYKELIGWIHLDAFVRLREYLVYVES